MTQIGADLFLTTKRTKIHEINQHRTYIDDADNLGEDNEYII